MGRIKWIDYARGIGIFGVVMWHVVGGIVNSGVSTTQQMADFGNLWDLYTFRLMPIFFFVSGAFFVRSLSRPFMQVFAGKFRTIAYPYFLWSTIMLVIGTLTIGIRNGSETLAEFPRLFYDPILHFWFLFALLVIMLMMYIVYALKINRWLILGSTLALFILSAATLFYDVWYVVGQIGYFAIYFLAGLWVGTDFLKTVDESRTSVNIGMFIVGGIALALIPITGMNLTAIIWQPLAATIAMIMTINMAVILARFDLLGFVRYWGELSLEIYLVHVLALSSIRIVMYNLLDIDNAWLHIIVGIIGGLYVPVAIKWLSDNIGTSIFFVAPRLPSRTKAPATELGAN